MGKLNDQAYLKEQQYKSAANLETRIDLHRRFGTNPYGWQRWVFDQLELQPGMQVLEVGCGPASLWRENLDRWPVGLRVAMGDLSVGMAAQACQTLANQVKAGFMAVDVQAIPFEAGEFERVIVNHMLYHVPDIPRAVDELYRVLKPGGWLCAATNGCQHLRELGELIRPFWPDYWGLLGQTRPFALENAGEILGRVFEKVEIRIYEANLVVTEVEPLVAYVSSMCGALGKANPEMLAEVGRCVEAKIAAEGAFRITKSQGVALATKVTRASKTAKAAKTAKAVTTSRVVKAGGDAAPRN